jgi:hypothetical protein
LPLRLGRIGVSFYAGRVIGLLRFVSLMNAAVWFGAAVCFVLGVSPVSGSPEMKILLGPKNFPYFSVAVGHLLSAGYYHLYLACSLVALLHLVAEWVYLGRQPPGAWIGLLLGLVLVGLLAGYVLEPRMLELHRLQFVRPDLREAAARSWRAWQIVLRVNNLLVLFGLGVYLWRIANPPDPTRFVSAAKFRS